MTFDGLRRRGLLLAAGGLAAGLAGCAGGGAGTPAPETEATAVAATEGTAAATDAPTPTPGEVDWRAVPLTDVVTDETFTVAGFEGQPVLLEFFAVWCPVCTSQQEVLREVTDRLDDLVVVSLNTDPNEDAERIRDHLSNHEGFDWRYAVAPSRMTRSLIDRFGSVIANPPAAPVVRVCPNGDATLLERNGVKPADDLVAAVERC